MDQSTGDGTKDTGGEVMPDGTETSSGSGGSPGVFLTGVGVGIAIGFALGALIRC